MSIEFFVLRLRSDSPWIMSTRAGSTIRHEDPEFKTGWTEPTAPFAIEVDDPRTKQWPDLIGCGGKIAGTYVSEKVVRDLDTSRLSYGAAVRASVVKTKSQSLDVAEPPQYFWLRGHVGAEIDYEKSGYEVIGRSSLTGKIYTNHRVRPHCLALVESSWDGSDLFLTGFPPTRFFCTRKLVELAAVQGWTNFCFVPIAEAADLSHPGVSL